MGAPIKPTSICPDGIKPYLEKHSISWEDFTKRMTRDPHIKNIRSQIVTELHEQGYMWKEMTELTTFGAGQLRAYTKAVGCKAAKQNQVNNGIKTGKQWKGKSRGDQLIKQWEKGDFDSLVGRKRPAHEIKSLIDSFTEERRAKISDRLKRQWEDPMYRDNLLAFHRSEEERVRRSVAQSERMIAEPEKWGWGCGQWVDATKCKNKGSRFWVRSSYEVATVSILEQDDNVAYFEYEHPFQLDCGRTLLPDFKVTLVDGTWKIVEVKAHWVLELPLEHPKQIKLQVYQELADNLEVALELWTEKGRLKGYV